MMSSSSASLLTLLLFILTALSMAKKCKDIIRKGQKFVHLEEAKEPPTIANFEKWAVNNPFLNSAIPPRCDSATRIVLYNLHQMMDARGTTEVWDQVEKDLRQMDAIVLVLQQVPLPSDPKKARLDALLASLGYSSVIQRDSMMITSQREIKQVTLDNVKVMALAGRVDVERYSVDIISLWMVDGHPGPGDTPPPVEATKGRVILHQRQRSDALYFRVETAHLEHGLFGMIGWQPPSHTAWTGSYTDYITAATRTFSKHLCGVYQYLTPSTGRTPLIVDVGNCVYVPRAPWFYWSIMGTFILMAIGGFFFFRRLNRH